jgi:hypothetical protein
MADYGFFFPEKGGAKATDIADVELTNKNQPVDNLLKVAASNLRPSLIRGRRCKANRVYAKSPA